jgi:hypothetical protein
MIGNAQAEIDALAAGEIHRGLVAADAGLVDAHRNIPALGTLGLLKSGFAPKSSCGVSPQSVQGASRSVFFHPHILTHLFHTATTTLRIPSAPTSISPMEILPPSPESTPSAITSSSKSFKAPDFIAAAIDHIPPKGQQTVRYHGLYFNKTRG